MIESKECTDSEIFIIEQKWRNEGYRLANKTDEKSLLPMEYIKSSHIGGENTFYGPRKWTITRRRNS